jgi:SAM-dependent methyltransferase
MAEQSFAPEDVNFEEFYQGESPFGDKMPWDIGRAQPILVAAVDSGQVTGEVLDIGCGLGDNSIFLASRGFHVTGVDGSPTALTRARSRAAEKGVTIDFQLGDATQLAGLENRFDTVIDSALYHCLTEEDRHTYMDALHRATKPGARLHLFCFSDSVPEAFPGPFRITEENIRTTVGRKWTITYLAPAKYDIGVGKESFGAMIKTLTPDADIESALAWLEETADGQVRMPIWQVAATRA